MEDDEQQDDEQGDDECAFDAHGFFLRLASCSSISRRFRSTHAEHQSQSTWSQWGQRARLVLRRSMGWWQWRQSIAAHRPLHAKARRAVFAAGLRAHVCSALA